ncbi:MAG: DUF2164 domain-containing protein [Rubrivivax sp.]|jgi:uncharacterized protein (DUF2164 family)|nr:DUF2164 domain-containing protein [Rubrivivax sp.]
MPIELSKDARAAAIRSLERYFQDHLDQRIGNIAAGGLLNFFLQEVAPLVYNDAVAQAQAHLQQRIADLDIDLHEEPFTYWKTHTPDAAKRRR